MGRPHSEPVVQSESWMILKGSLKLKAWSSACNTTGKWTFRRWGLMESHYGCGLEAYWKPGLFCVFCFLTVKAGLLGHCSCHDGPCYHDPKYKVIELNLWTIFFFKKKSFVFRVQGQKMPETGCLGFKVELQASPMAPCGQVPVFPYRSFFTCEAGWLP